MRRWLGWIVIAWLLAICALALVAYGNPSAHASLDQRTRDVAMQLRCPVCQGESVADSPSGIAQSMRRIIRRDLAEGKTPVQIKASFVKSYGDWILLAPPASGVGSLAWLAPPLLLLGGAGLLLTLLIDWRNRARLPTADGRAAYLERIRAEVAAERGE
jgi:cytochrome c-type biogenesis protein CcmH